MPDIVIAGTKILAALVYGAAGGWFVFPGPVRVYPSLSGFSRILGAFFFALSLSTLNRTRFSFAEEENWSITLFRLGLLVVAVGVVETHRRSICKTKRQSSGI